MTAPDTDDPTNDSERSGFSELTQAVLAEQAARESAAAQVDATKIRPDEELPGVGDKPMLFREGIAAGGVGVIAVLGTLDATDALQIAIPSLLGPEIQTSLGVSDTGLAVVGIGGLISATLCAVPMGRLADRIDRMKLVGWATLFWSLAMFFSRFSSNGVRFLLDRRADWNRFVKYLPGAGRGASGCLSDSGPRPDLRREECIGPGRRAHRPSARRRTHAHRGQQLAMGLLGVRLADSRARNLVPFCS